VSGFGDPLAWAAIAFLAITAGLGVTLHTLLRGPKARLRKRVHALVGATRLDVGGEGTAEMQSRRKLISGKLKELDASRKHKSGQSLRQLIVQAGLDLTPARFIAISAATAVVSGLIALVAGMPIFGIAACAIIGGLGLPRFTLNTLARRRVNKFTSHFADAIDVIVRSIRSGLPVGEALNIIVHEMPDPISAEFRQVVEGQKLGLTLDDALNRACERVPTAELRFFAIVLAIQQTTGGNLAETLAKLSDVLRGRKRMRDKVQAMSGEAKASAMIIGSLPFLVCALLAVVSPAYIAVLFTSNAGHLILFAGVTLMGIGVMVMRQMINFDI
jgi:tight adherence protein B